MSPLQHTSKRLNVCMHYKGSTKFQTRGLEEALALPEIDGSVSSQVSNLNFDQAEPYETIQKLKDLSQKRDELLHKLEAQQEEILSLQKQNQAHEKEKLEMKFALTKKLDGVLRNVANAARKEITGLKRKNAEDNLKHETAIARLAKELELRLENHENEKKLMRENKDLSIENMQLKMKADAENADFEEELIQEVKEHRKTKLESKLELDRQKLDLTQNQLERDNSL
jgi:hypothetical protein